MNDQKVTPKINDKWFKSVSDINIPTEICNFLALGPKFNLPISTKDLKIDILLADVEFLLR